MAQRTNAKLLAATVTPLLFFVADGLVLLPVLLEVLPLEDEEVEDAVEDAEEDDFDDVACSLALLKVEFAVELVPDVVTFATLPVLVVEFKLEPVIVELPEEPAAPVELLDLDPDEMTGILAPLFELVEAVEEAVAEPVEGFEAEIEARAAAALVGQVEQPPNSWSMPE